MTVLRSETRRSHRADVPATSGLPRPVKYAVGAAALAAVMAGSLAFANISASDDETTAEAGPALTALDGRGDVWDQVSRNDGYREPLLLEAGEPVTFTVTVDGKTLDVTGSDSRPLADALIDAGIVVDLDDVVSAAMGEPPAEGEEIVIERVGTQIETEVETLEYDTIKQETSALPTGTERVQTEGVNGSRVTTVEATYADGEVTSRTVLNSVLVSAPVDKVVLVGTGVAAPPPSTNNDSSSGSSSSGSSDVPTGSYSGSDPRSIAQQMLAAYGWGSDQFGCLDSLWQRESNWNPYAQNPSSGAYGIPQSLPGSKMESAGSDWRTNPATQIKWGLNYIQGRYGSPCGAWAHSQSVGWY